MIVSLQLAGEDANTVAEKWQNSEKKQKKQMKETKLA